MTRLFRNAVVYGVVLFCITACRNEPSGKQMQEPIPSDKALRQKIVEANKKYLKRENDEINQYVKLRGWDMITTGTGLRYLITHQGKGVKALPNREATISYKVSLLDGTLCYSSDSLGVKTFLIEKDNIESGIHEGIQYLQQGDKAIFIIPSHIAHGLLGDEDKIPSHATLVYELELLHVK